MDLPLVAVDQRVNVAPCPAVPKPKKQEGRHPPPRHCRQSPRRCRRWLGPAWNTKVSLPALPVSLSARAAAVQQVVAGVAEERVGRAVAIALQTGAALQDQHFHIRRHRRSAVEKTASVPSLAFSTTTSPALSTK